MTAAARALAHDAALARVLAAAAPLPAVHEPLERLVGRALREDIVAPHALPPFRNSAMDGWALRAEDTAAAAAGAPLTLPVVAVIAAGHPATRALGPREAMRIMTGAPLPAGADAVVPFEHGARGADARGGETCVLGAPARAGENVREAGADLAAGAVALAAGHELAPHDVALLAALGVTRAACGPLPRVAILSTGDELVAPGEPLPPGAIRDSNRVALAAYVREAPAEIVSAAHVGDDVDAIVAHLERALAEADVVLTTGGVSEGDFDPVKEAFARLGGGVELWRVSMRPGRPQAFGAVRGRLVYGLPGNPGSVAVVFETLVRPALRRLQGFAATGRARVPVRAACAIVSREGRADFVRCTLAWRDGKLWAAPAGAQVSGHLTPQSRAHGLLVVPAAAAELREGDAASAIAWRLP